MVALPTGAHVVLQYCGRLHDGRAGREGRVGGSVPLRRRPGTREVRGSHSRGQGWLGRQVIWAAARRGDLLLVHSSGSDSGVTRTWQVCARVYAGGCAWVCVCGGWALMLPARVAPVPHGRVREHVARVLQGARRARRDPRRRARKAPRADRVRALRGTPPPKVTRAPAVIRVGTWTSRAVARAWRARRPGSGGVGRV